MATPANIKAGDRVRTTNRRSHRHGGPPGVVIEVVETGRWRRLPGGGREHVGGDPDCEGPSFAWVLYEDGFRTPHELAFLELATGDE